MIKIHVVPGWSEGPWHVRQFEKRLKNIQLSKTSDDAEVVIAHSSGCYSIPDISSEKSYVLINPPYWPGRPIIRRAVQHVLLDVPKQIRRYGLRFWLAMRLHNALYIVLAPFKHTIKIHKILKKELLSDIKKGPILIIRNTRDAYCSADIEKLAGQIGGVKVKVIRGLHEDCWFDSTAIADIIFQS